MNTVSNRNKAIATMILLRDVVADRIAEIVNENEESLRADIEGVGFTLHNEFYDLVERLRSLSLAIDMMPRDQQPEVSVVDTLELAENGTINMGTFLEAVDRFDFQAASATLSIVFDLELERAGECARHFFKQCEDLENKFKVFQKVAHMRTASHNDLMMSVYELFDLRGLEALDAVQALRNGM